MRSVVIACCQFAADPGRADRNTGRMLAHALEPEVMDRQRRRHPLLRDRRPEAYGKPRRADPTSDGPTGA